MKSKPRPITWTTISKKTVVPGLKIERGKKYFIDSGELGIGNRTMYLLSEAGTRAKGDWARLGIVSEKRNGVTYPGAFKTVDSARAAAVEYERTGKMVRGDWSESEKALLKPVHPSLKVVKCICEHTKSRHRGAWGESHAGACKDCACEQFELEEKVAPAILEVPPEVPPEVAAFAWKKEWSKKAHPAAKLFPMLAEKELDEMAEDIKKNGQHDPIVITSDNLVLDGRNRLEACRRAGVEPEVQFWDREDDGISPTAWVLSKNLMRRQLTDGQRILVAVESIPMLEKEARARQRLGGVPPAGGKGPTVTIGRSAHVAAAALKVAPRSVERAKAVLAKAPASEIAKIRAGEKTFGQVERETKLVEQRAQVKAYVPPAGEYSVISVDFSWEYDDELDGEGARGGLGYPTMTIAEICAFPIPAAADCALFCWVTNSHLIDPEAYAVVAQSLFDRYGFRPKQIRTWRKVTNDGEKERFGGGRAWRNNTEHLVRFERGRPVFNAVTQATCFDAPRGKPSEKPAKAYEDIEALCASTSRLEMFARAGRAGWITSGSELPKPEPGEPGWVCPRGCGKPHGEHDGLKCPRRRLVIQDVEAATNHTEKR